MTEMLKPDHLRQIARMLDQSGEARERLIPVLQWTVDTETGRPVGNWVLNGDRDNAN